MSSVYGDDRAIFLLNASMTKDSRLEFKNPMVEIDIKTGKGYCNIREYWKNENLIKDEKESH